MRRSWTAAWFGAVLASMAGLVQAGVTLTGRYSEVSADAKAYGVEIFGEDDGPFDSDIETTTGFGDFAGRSASARSETAFSTEAQGYAWQTSSFTLAASDLRQARAQGEISADGLTSSGGMALAGGYSELTFGFAVIGNPVPYTLTGTLTSGQSGAILLRLANEAGGGTYLHALENNATVKESGMLQPGTYWFELSGYVSVFTDGVEHATGTFDVTLAFPAAPVPGDADGDGVVGLGDLALVDRGFAMGLTGYANGDFNGDNVINAADYAIIYNALAAPAGSPALSAVPEPASMTVLAFAAFRLAARRRRRCRG